MKYEPIFARVLIERELKEKIGSIYLPDNQKKRHASCVGKIVALGETASDKLQVGQTVVFGRYSGAWLDASFNDKGETNDDGKLFICQDEDILAIIRD